MTRHRVCARPLLPSCVLAVMIAGCSDDPVAPRTDASRGHAAALAGPVMPVDLGTPGATSGMAIDINDSGVIVGSLRDAAGTSTYVRWFASGALDTVPLVAVVGIGNDGSVAGQADNCNAGRWVPGAGVATAQPLVPGGCMRARAVSPGGNVIAGAADVIPEAPFFIFEKAFVWTPTSLPPSFVWAIPSFPPYRFMSASGVNSSGTAVGSITRGPPVPMEMAFVVWPLAPSITLTGSSPSRATAINTSGTVVGTQASRAVRFHAGTPYTDDLLPGVTSSSADAINDKGEVVLNAGNEAYLLRGGALIPLAGLGGTLMHASAVNERSQVVGWAYDARGVMRPVRWDVDAPPLVAMAGGPYMGVEGTPVSFAGSATGAGPSATYAWSFGDGATGMGANVAHAYADNAAYTATLTVTDGARQATATALATIANAPPTIGVAPGGTIYSGETFIVRARFDDAGTLDAPWRWVLRDADSTVLGAGQATVAPDSILVPVTLRRAGTHWLSLTVTDKDGGTTGGLARIEVLRLPVPMGVAPPSLHAATRGNGLLTVTLFATPVVSPSAIVVASVRLGDALALATKGNGTPMAALEDVNGDGVMELVLKFRRGTPAAEAALTGSGGVLVLRADLVDGRQVEGRYRWPTPATGQ